jgi:uncharacterized protein
MPNLWLIFTTGLLTGGLTCMAVQGSLLAATLVSEESRSDVIQNSASRIRAITAFLIAKIIAYSILGFLLGYLGSFFTLSIPVQIVMTVLVAVFMIGTAGNLLHLHPVFRYFVIAPPRFLSRFIRRQSKSGQVFAPAMLGALTVFIPCGTTQAMMVFAVGTGNPLYGALVMASFTLGTVPVFFALGYSLTKLKDVLAANFARISAFTLVFMAFWNLNSALALTGSDFTVQQIGRSVYCAVTFCRNDGVTAASSEASDEVTIEFMPYEYKIDNPVIKAGSDVTLHLKNTAGQGCIQAFTIPKLGIQEIVPVGATRDIKIKAPDEPGTLSFMCTMGMYRGAFTVVL